jgi:hypothetical protein
MKNLYSGLRELSFGINPAAVIGQRLGVDPSIRKAIHLPWFAEKTTGSAVFRAFTLVVCHGLRSRACRFLGGGDCSPSWQSFCGRNTRQHLFPVPRAPSFWYCMPGTSEVSSIRCIPGLKLYWLN